ncbi:hypothetical protein H8S95_04870 [Pontibacter sp. KCTC 32443]|uniref:hypothetical protein n=1 Tax=Pontibacter TaxID=323449 RepID=UPI00164E44F7|nr:MULTISPECIES: hypothetical protein [Pontibacter]MBC5773389.1 hypothetical protein [Pontibacter sp. KCTC 32443]
MKKMKKVKLFTLSLTSSICLLCINAQAQITNYTNQDSFFGNGGFIHSVTPNSKTIKGSPFIFDFWYDATIISTNNQEFENIKVKYNIHLNEVLALRPTGDSVALNNNFIKEFVITDLKMNKIRFKRLPNINTNNASLRNAFVNIIYEGKILFIAEVKSKILKAEKVQGGYGTYRETDEFTKETTYYYIDKDKSPIEVKLNKKSLLTVLSNKQDAIKAFISNEKIDANTEQGWVKALAYYETL